MRRPAASRRSTPARWCRGSGWRTDPLGDGRFTIQSTYSHYAGKYSETQFAETTNVGNPDVLIGIYTGPSGQGRDFAPGFDPDNYFIVDGSFATQNVMLDPNLKSPLTKEFTVSGGGTLGNRGHLKATYIRRRAGNFIEDFLDLSTGATESHVRGPELRHVCQPGFPQHG